MPIVFAQPDPLSPAITAGAAAAEFAAKTFPSIASIYENAARLRASAGGGGGHGSPGSTGGYVQVLPSGDSGGALAQVEQQANREQRALDLGFEAQQDPVAGHIRQQQQFKMQQQQSAQDNENQQLALLNPQLQAARGQRPTAQPPEPPPTTWMPDDDKALAGTIQGISDVRDKYNNGAIDLPTYYKMNGPLQAQRDQLVAKQRKAQEDTEKQQVRKAATDQANQRGLLDLDMRHAGQTGYRQIPDLPTPIYDIDKHTGKKYMINVEEYKAATSQKEKAIEYNHKIDLEAGKRKAEVEKADQAAEEHYLKHWGEAYKTVNKLEDEFMKGNTGPGTANNRYRPNPQERAQQVGEHLEALGLSKSLEEFRRQRKGLPVPVIPAEPGKPSAVPMNTSKGQQEALDAILGKLAHTIPEPTPRKTVNPPGPLGAEAQAAQTNEQAGWGQFGPQF